MAGLSFIGLATTSSIADAPVAVDRVQDRVVVGGLAYTEQYVVGEITRQLIEMSGAKAVTRFGHASAAARAELQAGGLDVFWDYAAPTDAVAQSATLATLNRSSVNGAFVLAASPEFVARTGVRSLAKLADMRRQGAIVRLASDQECHRRADCLSRVEQIYDFRLEPADILVMNVADTAEALAVRNADIAVMYATSAKLLTAEVVLLHDPQRALTDRFLVPVVRKDALKRRPELEDLLNDLAASLDSHTVRALSYEVEVQRRPLADVARRFVETGAWSSQTPSRKTASRPCLR